MELSVRKTELLRELQLFQGIVERKNTIPILANILVEAEDGAKEVRLIATDLEVGLRSRCPAEVTKGGALTLPAKKLYEIVRALPETELRITQSAKGSVNVAAERFSSRMQTLPREDFPALPEATGANTVNLPCKILSEMVAKTQCAVTGEDTRFFLNGALLVFSGSSMSLVATDGYRLALVSASREGVTAGAEEGTSTPDESDSSDQKDEGAETRVILPKKTLWELARLFDNEDGAVVYERGENHLFFDIGGRQLVSRVLDAQFPAYENAIPKSNDKRIEFERDRLTSAVKRVALLSSERSRAVKLQIDAGKVEITSSSPEIGEASEVISVEYDGEALAICLNAQYLLDFLAVADSESVALDLKDEMSQAVLSPLSTGGCDYTYVIMPIRI
ncbi:MAG: DNA polymerase III subunit beta [Vicinamibacterales bacterium]|jgi:DNA polymerase-3 subunit beta|nr:DNA polymerase III subunit beta [Vicinamibacterales bacterium]HJN44356.1 DNA polymerase III subunit beta [Vicinamibacterales bacterium]|tara:strand:+ start:733 stop:1908 length:1176 start_codon:yes stop_codon:yes gene_type:complete